MSIYYGLYPETFKLVQGNGRWPINIAKIVDAPKEIKLTAAKNSTAAFQVIIKCDEDWALSIGKSAWFSQKGAIKNVRLSVESELETNMNILDVHAANDGNFYADALLTNEVVELRKVDVRTVYVECKIPKDIKCGDYDVKIKLTSGRMFEDEEIVGEMSASVKVYDYVMRDGKDYKFYLDLWQHNSNLARKAEVELWSDEHFAVMEKYVKSLGELGQKAATLVVSEIPWSGQSCYYEYRMDANLFEYSIIETVKNINGEFVYDYTKMQRYIDLCAKYGVDKEISLYGLANVWGDPDAGFSWIAPDYPDGIKLRYYDEASGTYKFMRKAADIDAYIKSLEQYFVTTGQIEKVRLAADEPGDVVAYRKSLDHLTSIAPAFKFKAAINHSEFIPEFGKEVYDFAPYIGCLCKEYDKLKEYQATMKDKRFIWYVCCGPEYPNTFVDSKLTESLFIGILTSYTGLDGFLRWNYYVWNDDPRKDIRYGNWRAGDTNFVYPSGNGAPLLTLRYKALKRGIEFYEMLEDLKKKDANEAEKAFDFVVREKDVRKYFSEGESDMSKSLRLDEMCSLEYEDYEAMRKYLLEKLS